MVPQEAPRERAQALGDRVTPEGRLTAQITRWLKTQRDVFFWKVQATAFSLRGVPDICGNVGGAALYLELKAGGRYLSPSQAVVRDRIRAAGGRAYVVRSLADAKEVIEELRACKV